MTPARELEDSGLRVLFLQQPAPIRLFQNMIMNRDFLNITEEDMLVFYFKYHVSK